MMPEDEAIQRHVDDMREHEILMNMMFLVADYLDTVFVLDSQTKTFVNIRTCNRAMRASLRFTDLTMKGLGVLDKADTK